MKSELSINQYAQLLSDVKSLGLDALAPFIEHIKKATFDHHYFACLQKAVHHYADLCNSNSIDKNAHFLLTHSDNLLKLMSKLLLSYQNHKASLSVTKPELRKIFNDGYTLNRFILSACQTCADTALPTPPTKDTLTLIQMITKHVFNLCFDEDLDLDQRMEMQAITIQRISLALIMYVHQHISDLIKTDQDDITLQSIRSNLDIIIDALQKNKFDAMSLNNMKRLCIVIDRARTLSKKRRAEAPKADMMLFTPRKIQLLQKNENLSQVRANYYDFDDTIYHKAACIIPNETMQRMRVLHEILGLEAHIITARNHAMDHDAHYYKDKDGNINLIKKEWATKGSVYTLLSRHQLHHLFSKDQIIYCDFYHKVEVNNHADFTFYYDYSDPKRKNSKLDDFKKSVDARGLKPSQTAIFDDTKNVWSGIDAYSPNFFYVNNQSPGKSLNDHLSNQIVQLILYGDHLPKKYRIDAAQACIDGKFFTTQYQEYAALTKFIRENPSIEESPTQSLSC